MRLPAVGRALRSRALELLLIAPAMLHLIGVGACVARAGSFAFSRLDLIVNAIVFLYLCLAVLLLPSRTLSRKFVLFAYAVLVPILLLEGVAFLAGSHGSGRVPWPPVRRVAEAADTMPGIEGEIRFTVNQRGVRAPEVWPSSRRDRILCVGGSTTECLYVSDEKSWPWLVGARLSDREGRPILVANAGRSGHFTLHHEYQLRHYPEADQFGTIVALVGINDAGTLLRDNYEKRREFVSTSSLIGTPRYEPYYRNSILISALTKLLDLDSVASSVEQDAAGAWYADQRKTRQRRLRRNRIDSVPDKLNVALRTYHSNLVRIIRLCKQRDQHLVFMTQPTVYRKDLPDELRKLIWQHTDTGAHTPAVLAQVLSAYNQELRSICSEHDIACIDLDRLIPKDTSAFYDDCHFNDGGCDLVATALLDHLLDSRAEPTEQR